MVLSDAIGALRRRGSPRLWLILGVPPIAWFAALNAAYFFVSWACHREYGELVLHAIMVIALVATAASGVAALRLLRDVGETGDDAEDVPRSRTRFLARLGVFGAITFTLVVIALWVAVLILDPCMPPPRERFSPDALRAPAAPTHAIDLARLHARGTA